MYMYEYMICGTLSSMDSTVKLWLKIKDKSNVVTAIPLREGETLFGRGGEADVVLPGCKVSARHCLVTRLGNEIAFQDLNSTWGTQYNGNKSASGTMSVGDILEIGRTELLLCDELTTDVEEPQEAKGLDWEPFTLFLQELQRANDTKGLVKSLLFGLVDIVSAERGFVLLESDESKKLEPVISHSLPSDEDLVSVSSTIYRQALKNVETVLVENSLLDSRCLGALSLARPEKPLTIICCPLGKKKPFGVLYLDRPAASPMDEQSINVIETIANLTASLLEAAETRQELKRTRNRLEALNILAWEKERFILGESEVSRQLSKLLRTAAKQDVTVLITGETGTGKEMVARTLHRLSPRFDGPFVPVNCAALPPSLIEAELFGAEKGAFTGADKAKAGRFQLAEGGTLFLDEVGELPLDVQIKLLRVLQEREVTPVGGTGAVPLDFRLLCATNRDLDRAVKEGELRPDFYYRINVFNIQVPPLRERKEDIIPLANHFLASCCERFGRQKISFSPSVELELTSSNWPGNVRELKNAIERAVVMSEGPMIETLFLNGERNVANDSEGIGLANLPQGFDAAQDLFRRIFIERTLLAHMGNVSAAAKAMGLTRPTLYRHIKLLGIDIEELCKKS